MSHQILMDLFVDGYGNMNAWQQSQSSSRGGSSSSRFGGFNPNAPVFTPGAQFMSENVR